MKKHVVYYGLLVLLAPFLIFSIPESQPEQPIPTVKPNPKLIRIDREKWQFFHSTLTFELEQAQGIKNKAGTYIETKANTITEMAAAPLTILAGILTEEHLTSFFPPDYNEHNYLWISTGVVGTILFYITKFLVPRIGSLLASHGAVAIYALNNFMDGWTDFRAKCPAEIYPLFDSLAADYNTSDLLTTITDDQAFKIVQAMLSLSALVAQLDGLLLEHTLTRQEETEEVYTTFINTTVKSLMSTTRSQTDLKTQKNQWEYVAQQLGILNHPQAVITPIKKFFYEFEVPLMLAIGFPVGSMIGHRIATALPEVTREDTDIIHIGQLIGGTLGALTISLMSRFMGIPNMQAFYRQQLEAFLENWHAHKQRCPASIVPLFNQLSNLYHSNSQSLSLDDTFIEELYRTVAKMWLKISSAESTNSKDEL